MTSTGASVTARSRCALVRGVEAARRHRQLMALTDVAAVLGGARFDVHGRSRVIGAAQRAPTDAPHGDGEPATSCPTSVLRLSLQLERAARRPQRDRAVGHERTRSRCRGSTASRPRTATPARAGTITAAIPSASASAQACSGPAPPNATSASPRGSTPRSTVTRRTASSMAALTTAITSVGVDAAPSQRRRRRLDGPGGRARRRWRLGGDGPATRLASVTVGAPAAAVAGRPGPGPGAAGPATCSAPPASRSAIEPPPAPMVCTSSDGSRIGNPATRRSPAGAGRPPSTRQTSVLVPPMSKVTASSNPAPRAAAAAAMTPPAGPDSNKATGRSAASVARAPRRRRS